MKPKRLFNKLIGNTAEGEGLELTSTHIDNRGRALEEISGYNNTLGAVNGTTDLIAAAFVEEWAYAAKCYAFPILAFRFLIGVFSSAYELDYTRNRNWHRWGRLLFNGISFAAFTTAAIVTFATAGVLATLLYANLPLIIFGVTTARAVYNLVYVVADVTRYIIAKFWHNDNTAAAEHLKNATRRFAAFTAATSLAVVSGLAAFTPFVSTAVSLAVAVVGVAALVYTAFVEIPWLKKKMLPFFESKSPKPSVADEINTIQDNLSKGRKLNSSTILTCVDRIYSEDNAPHQSKRAQARAFAKCLINNKIKNLPTESTDPKTNQKIQLLNCLLHCVDNIFLDPPSSDQATKIHKNLETIQTFQDLNVFIHAKENKKIHDDIFSASISKTSDTNILYQLVEKIIAEDKIAKSKSSNDLLEQMMPRDSSPTTVTAAAPEDKHKLQRPSVSTAISRTNSKASQNNTYDENDAMRESAMAPPLLL